MIVFTHIMKTSGTSFFHTITMSGKTSYWKRQHFIKLCKNSEIGFSYRLKHKIPFDVVELPKVLQGHFAHGIHELFATSDYVYVTFLRDPIERTKSSIAHGIGKAFKGHIGNFIGRTFFDCQKNIIDILVSLASVESCCNIMTKQLSGLENLENLILYQEYDDVCHYGLNYSVKRRYSKQEMEKFLSAAKRNISKYIFVGFQENGSDDHRIGCDILRLPYTRIDSVYASYKKEKSLINWDNPRVHKLLHEMNVYDIQLYEYAKTLKRGR